MVARVDLLAGSAAWQKAGNANAGRCGEGGDPGERDDRRYAGKVAIRRRSDHFGSLMMANAPGQLLPLTFQPLCFRFATGCPSRYDG